MELAAVAASAHIEVTTSDRKGIIFLDGKPVAEGAFAADVAIGPHTIAVTREGYERYEKKVILADKQSLAETVTLKLPEAKTTGGRRRGADVRRRLRRPRRARRSSSRAARGTRSTPDCAGSRPRAARRRTRRRRAHGVVRLRLAPVGVEAFLAGRVRRVDAERDVRRRRPRRSRTRSPCGQPRVEQFAFLRFGGMAAVRARVSRADEPVAVQPRRGLRRLGQGHAPRLRQTQSNSGGEPTRTLRRRERAHRTSRPALSGDLSARPSRQHDDRVRGRRGRDVRERGAEPHSPREHDAGLAAARDRPSPLPTPAYHLASGAQTFIGPYIGLAVRAVSVAQAEIGSSGPDVGLAGTQRRLRRDSRWLVGDSTLSVGTRTLARRDSTLALSWTATLPSGPLGSSELNVGRRNPNDGSSRTQRWPASLVSPGPRPHPGVLYGRILAGILSADDVRRRARLDESPLPECSRTRSSRSRRAAAAGAASRLPLVSLRRCSSRRP